MILTTNPKDCLVELFTMDLFCASKPQPRNRSNSKRKTNYLDLSNQNEMLKALQPYEDIWLEMPLGIEIEYIYSTSNGNAERYDLDNLLKGTLDNLQRLRIIKDDSQIVFIDTVKYYSSDDHTIIRLYELDNTCLISEDIKKLRLVH